MKIGKNDWDVELLRSIERKRSTRKENRLLKMEEKIKNRDYLALAKRYYNAFWGRNEKAS